jgi:hypothetical protein
MEANKLQTLIYAVENGVAAVTLNRPAQKILWTW